MADRRPSAAEPTRTVRNEDWGGQDLQAASETGVSFIDIDMSEVSTAGAVYDECTFRDVRFNASTHVTSAFLNCTFITCDFFDASFTGCKFVGSRFSRCSLNLLRVHGGDWSYVGLAKADLRTVKFVEVRMREADLTGARCDGATLSDVDLSGALLMNTTWRGSDLRGSDLSSLDPNAADLRGAIITWEQCVVLAVNLGLDVR